MTLVNRLGSKEESRHGGYDVGLLCRSSKSFDGLERSGR
jgi:hypothetical protein